MNQKTAVAMPSCRQAPQQQLLLTALLHVLVAAVFLRGFLLTRLELPDVARCAPPAACSSSGGQPPPAFSKAVLVIVDAVRHDFLCGAGTGSGSRSSNSSDGTAAATSLMPKTLALVEASVSCVSLSQELLLLRARRCSAPHSAPPPCHHVLPCRKALPSPPSLWPTRRR